MRTLENFKTVVIDSYITAEKALAEQVQKIVSEKKDQLVTTMEKDRFIKIPFVGDFSSGKSSLINAMIGKKEFLPTDISPLTAVSYELYYDANERLEHWKKGQLVDTFTLEQIKDINVTAGDIIKVFINNEQVKKWNAQNIVVVDMPGIDSGLQEHNDAIMNYIEEGTCFIIAVDAEQGTLRSSTLDFLREVQQYNLSAYVVLTKADKKTSEDVASIQSLITKQADLYIKGAKTGVTSAVNNQFEDVLNFIESIDVEEVFKQKHQSSVEAFTDNLIKDIRNEYSLLMVDKTDLENKKNALLAEFEETQKKLEVKKNEALLSTNSVGDILNAVQNALENKSKDFANILIQNKTNLKPFNSELLSTIRPVIISQLGKEAEEYIHILGKVASNFQEKTNSIINENNPLLDQLVVHVPALEKVLRENLTKVITPILATLKLSKFLRGGGPVGLIISVIVSKLLEFALDKVLQLFGKDSESIVTKVESVFVDEIIPSIIEDMKPEIEQVVDEQQKAIVEAIEKEIKGQRDILLAQIQDAEAQQKISEEEINTKKEELEAIVKGILEIKKQVA